MRPRRMAASGLAATMLITLAACGGDASAGAPVLNWYVNPDNGGQARIAQECSDASNGAYTISIQRLPRDAPGQREQLVRRLAANDDSIDLMSLDPPFIPEFAEAGYLAPVPEDVATEVTDGVVDSALKGSTWKDELVTLPFWANTQLLWFRKSVAEQAGLDMEQPVTWDQIITAAEDTGKTVAVQGTRAESMTVWVNALIASAGGEILKNPDAPADEYQLGLDSEQGREAATIMRKIADTGVGGAQLSTSTEDTNASLFESDNAGFMVNWPFVWARGEGAVEAGSLDQSALDDYGWAQYPETVEGEPSKPPYGGINLGVSALSNNVDLAYEAGRCIVGEDKQKAYMLSDGNPAAKEAVYDDPEIQDQYPMADTIRESLQNAAPRPLTPYYNEISTGIQNTWQPPAAVSPDTTPPDSQKLITEVLRGEALL